MNRLSIFLITLLVAQLLLWGGLEFTKPERSIREEKTRSLLETEARSVKAVELSGEDGSLSFVIEDQRWQDADLENFPVNQYKLAEFLSKITDLKRGLPVSFSEGSHERFEVAEEDYKLKVRFKKTDGASHVLFFGKPATIRQSYVRLAGEDSVYIVDVESWELDTSRDNWLDKGYLRISLENVSAIILDDMTFKKKDNLFTLGAENYDQSKVDKFLETLTDLQLSHFVQEEELSTDDSGFEKLFKYENAAGSSGQVMTMSTPDDEASYFVRRTDKKGTFKIAAEIVKEIRAASLEEFLGEANHDK